MQAPACVWSSDQGGFQLLLYLMIESAWPQEQHTAEPVHLWAPNLPWLTVAKAGLGTQSPSTSLQTAGFTPPEDPLARDAAQRGRAWRAQLWSTVAVPGAWLPWDSVEQLPRGQGASVPYHLQPHARP